MHHNNEIKWKTCQDIVLDWTKNLKKNLLIFRVDTKKKLCYKYTGFCLTQRKLRFHSWVSAKTYVFRVEIGWPENINFCRICTVIQWKWWFSYEYSECGMRRWIQGFSEETVFVGDELFWLSREHICMKVWQEHDQLVG